jgi:hypothetical protein
VLCNTAAAAAATSEVKITTRKRAVIERERERAVVGRTDGTPFNRQTRKYNAKKNGKSSSAVKQKQKR